MLNRLGVYMYWDNCWVNFFNKKNFFNKTLLLVDFFCFFFQENLFFNFFKKIFFQKLTDKNKFCNFFKKPVLRKKDSKIFEKFKKKKIKYNFTKL